MGNTGSAVPRAPFPVVALGGSAGALGALQAFFRAMPSDSGCAFVVITHQHPGRTSLLPELLAKVTDMPVVKATDHMPVEPDHVYVAVPKWQLAIADGMLTAHNEPEAPGGSPEQEQSHSTRASHHPIDGFFRALAAERGELAIAVVLSGTGTDGSIGLKDIKAESGMVIAQQPDTAEFDGMPLSALRTGLVDHSLPPDGISGYIFEYARALARRPSTPPEGEPARLSEETQNEILILLRQRCGHDFSGYKPRTMYRRIQRRMDIRRIERGDEYLDYLRLHPDEIDTLFREAIVNVTRFFRDSAAWQKLGTLLQETIRALPEDGELRAWVVGCATGEEAYTLAMVANECMESENRRLPVRVFGSDIEPHAIETARQGEYPTGIERDVPEPLLRKYFLRDQNHFRARKSLREQLVFTIQNVAQDPPFTRMDVVSCRNLLIYMQSSLQRKVIPVLHYALKPGGLLFLGSSETVNQEHFSGYFDTEDTKWKLYRRGVLRMPDQAMPQLPIRVATRRRSDPRSEDQRPSTFRRIVERLLLERFVPASAIVSENGDASYFHGTTGKYLEPATGVPGNNILEMAREGLRPALFDALRAAAEGEPHAVVQRNTHMRIEGKLNPVIIQVIRLEAPESVRGQLLVSLQPKDEPAHDTEPDQEKPARQVEEPGKQLDQLQRELEAMAAEKRWTMEQLKSTNEDLQTANEELQSTNEELQSTNEELETSKEEMESLNEELIAVNAELQEKINSLEKANDDMNNMLDSTEIAILFLTNELEVRRYTEKVRDLISLRESDIGRPIGDLASNLKYETFVADAQTVLQTAETRDIDFQTKDGYWSRMRLMPYWTADHQIDGLVCTFVSVEEAKHAEQREAYFRSIVNTVREPLVVLDASLRVVSANNRFYATFGLTALEVEGTPIFSLAGGQWDMPDLHRLLEGILPHRHSLTDYRLTADFEHVGRKRLLLNARRIEGGPENSELILLAIEEIDSEGDR